jgi:hypothetical protein
VARAVACSGARENSAVVALVTVVAVALGLGERIDKALAVVRAGVRAAGHAAPLADKQGATVARTINALAVVAAVERTRHFAAVVFAPMLAGKARKNDLGLDRLGEGMLGAHSPLVAAEPCGARGEEGCGRGHRRGLLDRNGQRVAQACMATFCGLLTVTVAVAVLRAEVVSDLAADA